METTESKTPFNGTAVTGAALGGSALLVSLLNGGIGNLLGGGMRPPAGDPPWSRDLQYERELTTKDSEIGQLKAEKYADTVVLAAERRLADKIAAIETGTAAAFAKQNEYNVANTAAVASINGQVAQLMSMTGIIINAPAMAASQAAASAFTGKTATTAATGS